MTPITMILCENPQDVIQNFILQINKDLSLEEICRFPSSIFNFQEKDYHVLMNVCQERGARDSRKNKLEYLLKLISEVRGDIYFPLPIVSDILADKNERARFAWGDVPFPDEDEYIFSSDYHNSTLKMFCDPYGFMTIVRECLINPDYCDPCDGNLLIERDSMEIDSLDNIGTIVEHVMKSCHQLIQSQERLVWANQKIQKLIEVGLPLYLHCGRCICTWDDSLHTAGGIQYEDLSHTSIR